MIEDPNPEAEIGIMYPDVEVFDSRRVSGEPGTATPAEARVQAGAALEAPLTIPRLSPVEVRLTSVEVRNAAENDLVTSIEIASPVNKREPGLSKYRRKRERLLDAGVHLLEIDLLRRGTRTLAGNPRLPPCAYLLSLTRHRAPRIGVWPLHLQDALPEVPVPLREPDADVVLPLSECLRTLYDVADYSLSIDYSNPPPPPPLSSDDEGWVRGLLAEWRRGARGKG